MTAITVGLLVVLFAGFAAKWLANSREWTRGEPLCDCARCQPLAAPAGDIPTDGPPLSDGEQAELRCLEEAYRRLP